MFFGQLGFFFFLAARKVQHTSKEQVCTKCCQKPDYLNSLVTLKGGAGSIRRDAVNHTNEDNSIPKQYQMGIKACIVLHSVLHTKCNGSSCVKNKKESLRKRSWNPLIPFHLCHPKQCWIVTLRKLQKLPDAASLIPHFIQSMLTPFLNAPHSAFLIHSCLHNTWFCQDNNPTTTATLQYSYLKTHFCQFLQKNTFGCFPY